jgi:hypothetical protein
LSSGHINEGGIHDDTQTKCYHRHELVIAATMLLRPKSTKPLWACHGGVPRHLYSVQQSEGTPATGRTRCMYV